MFYNLKTFHKFPLVMGIGIPFKCLHLFLATLVHTGSQKLKHSYLMWCYFQINASLFFPFIDAIINNNSILNLDEQNIMESIAILFCFAWSDHLSFCFSFSFKMIILILYSISIVGIMLYLLISCSCVDQSLILKFLVFFFLGTMITSIISLIHNQSC